VLIAVVLAAVLAVAAVAAFGRDDESPSATATTEAVDTEAAGSRPGCQNGAWPGLYVGQPTALAANGQGYYVWNDYSGWHVRFIGTDEGGRVAGTVTGSARLRSATPVPADVDGAVTVDANVATFDLAAGPSAVGFDLDASCASTTVRFELRGPGGLWPVESIFVGRDGRAVSNPLLVERAA
jgi:hypothetical protein